MTNIRSIDMMFLDDVFDMGGGYVLNFSDRTFAKFVAEELLINNPDAVLGRQLRPDPTVNLLVNLPVAVVQE